MKKIVIIGANEFQNPLILKAKEMGFETHVFAWRDGAVGEKTADFFYPISITEREEILAECKRIRPDAVCTIASDLANLTVQYLAKELGLPHNSDACILTSTNKYQMRKALLAGGADTPFFATVSSFEEASALALPYPVIVKPTDRSGSRGITKVLSPDGLKAAIDAAVSHSFEKRAMVEEYIDGDEFSAECVSFNGTHTLLTVTQKFTTGAPGFIEVGHIEPAPLSAEMLEKVKKEVFLGLSALGIRMGAAHAEFRIGKNGRVRIIEIGSRMGGDCIGSHLVPLSTGIDFVRAVIDTALGNTPDLTPKAPARASAIRFVFDKEDMDVLARIKETHPEALALVSDIEPLGAHEITDSGSRLGFYILTADTYEEILSLSEL